MLKAGTIIGEEEMNKLRDDPTVDRVRVLSPLTDDSPLGISAKAYGMSLATGGMVELGEAVGVIAAQSIGEPGTQLTMRTFHTGGIAGSDIAGGLPRVVELFEARSPKNKAILARTSGVVRLGEDEGKGRSVLIVADDGSEDVYIIPQGARIESREGQEIVAGTPIVEGARDPEGTPRDPRHARSAAVPRRRDPEGVSRSGCVDPRQAHRVDRPPDDASRRRARAGRFRLLAGRAGRSPCLHRDQPGLLQEGKRPAEARPELMGITKASLATDSWLSAASFQETTRVLTEAAIDSKSDGLLGLKENIIIGKLIPAGTGMPAYRTVQTHAPGYQPMEYYSSTDEDQDLADWLAGRVDTMSATAAAEDLSYADAAEAEVIDLARIDDVVVPDGSDEAAG